MEIDMLDWSAFVRSGAASRRRSPILSYIATIISTSFREKARRFKLRFFSAKGSADPPREHRLLRAPMFYLRRSRSTSMQERPLSLSRHGGERVAQSLKGKLCANPILIALLDRRPCNTRGHTVCA